MLPLDKDLQKVKSSINDFFEITNRVLDYFPNVINNTIEKGDYLISSSNIAGTIKFLRPINRKLFIQEKNVFNDYFQRLILIFENIRNKKNVTEEDKIIIDRVIYTIQQSIGIGLDLMVNQNSARKHVGNRFEELIRVIFTEISVSNKRTVLQIPYETDEGQKIYI